MRRDRAAKKAAKENERLTQDVRIPLTPTMRAALEKMAADDMRTVTGLVRKILADHLVNHKYLDREVAFSVPLPEAE